MGHKVKLLNDKFKTSDRLKRILLSYKMKKEHIKEHMGNSSKLTHKILLTLSLAPLALLANFQIKPPKKVPCGNSGSIIERAKDCNTTVTSSTGHKWTVIAFMYDSDGTTPEGFLQDNATGLIWGPAFTVDDKLAIESIRSQKQLTFLSAQHAKEFEGDDPNDKHADFWKATKFRCEARKDLGLSWSLPTAVNDSNVSGVPPDQKQYNIANSHGINTVLDMNSNRFWWSGSKDKSNTAFVFDGFNGYVDSAFRDNHINPPSTGYGARCVAQGTAKLASKKTTCGISGSVEDRAKDCNETKKSSTGNSWTLISRQTTASKRGLREYWQDDDSGLIWGPTVFEGEIVKLQRQKKLTYLDNSLIHKDNEIIIDSEHKIPYPDYWQAAIQFCKSQKDLSLSWSLPTASQSNEKEQYNIAMKHGFQSVIDMPTNRYWWSASSSPMRMPFFYFGNGLQILEIPQNGILDADGKLKSRSAAHCVAFKKK